MRFWDTFPGFVSTVSVWNENRSPEPGSAGIALYAAMMGV
jgi:hypothetical protein